MTVVDWLGKDNTLGISIWEKKYRYNNESFDYFDKKELYDYEFKIKHFYLVEEYYLTEVLLTEKQHYLIVTFLL